MSDRQYDYDSEAVRSEARKFEKCCDTLDGRALPKIRSIRSGLDGNFAGVAADALEHRLDDEETDIRGLRNACYNMYSALMHYADELERIDRELAEMMDD